METGDAAETLARSSRGAMMAAAGCGKTQVIATAVSQHGGFRELILTHTHAGIDVLRMRLRRLKADPAKCHLDTIAGWSLRLAKSFPKTADLPTDKPSEESDYSAIYRGATRLVSLLPIQDILHASYSGIYVDEYQDCTLDQHALVVALAQSMPCRILGDPLQSIFRFSGQPIEWSRDILPRFTEVEGPSTPVRWRESNPALGEWLGVIRARLERGESIDLSGAPVSWVDGSDEKWKRAAQAKACMSVGNRAGETVVVLHQRNEQGHQLARGLSGRFSCIEPIDAPDLRHAAQRIDATRGAERAIAIIDFASECMTQVSSELSGVKAAFAKGKRSRSNKHAAQVAALWRVAESEAHGPIADALDALARTASAVNHRRELLYEMKRAVQVCAAGDAATLEEAVWIVRSRTSRYGRRPPLRAVGTTLLVKGLDFDHAIVADADGYDARNLYVALTRGKRSLTIVSDSRTLTPESEST